VRRIFRVFLPEIVIEPPSAGNIPKIVLTVVVFPAPMWPPSAPVMPPKRLVRSLACKMESAPLQKIVISSGEHIDEA
jgi:hypothetical protein